MATVPTLSTPPSRSDPINFNSRADTFFGELPGMATGMNAVAAEVNTNKNASATSATNASNSATTATTQAGIATTQAGISTTQAGIATTQAGISTTQAGIATTQATNASNSATAASGSATTAQNWAIKTDGPVSGGDYSAKYWAEQAAGSVADGVIDDGVTSTLKTWSSSKISTELGGKQVAMTQASQVEMEAGTLSTIRSMSPLLVAQAIAALGQSKVITSDRSGNAILAAADNGKLINYTAGGFTQTFTAATTLGHGWWCYLENSSTGDVTLDPNGSETIDGLTSFVMYPGEVRLLHCDGSALRSVVLHSFYRTFTTSGSFIKPPGYRRFSGIMWGGGSSGASKGSDAADVFGGGGGGCGQFSIDSADVAASTTVTIGAGGASVTAPSTTEVAGNRGGTTSFGSHFSCVAGVAFSSGGSFADADLAIITSGPEGIGTTISKNTMWGGLPSATSSTSYKTTYGGGGGGCREGGNTRLPGTSKFGGDGGVASASVPGAGGIPGGGGGANYGSNLASGAGARGEVRIWGVA